MRPVLQFQLHSDATPPHLSNVPSSANVFSSRSVHRAWLATQARLPAGFRVGTARFSFIPFEVPKPAQMTLTLIALDRPSADFAAVFTRNAFPGAPVVIGRARLADQKGPAGGVVRRGMPPERAGPPAGA